MTTSGTPIFRAIKKFNKRQYQLYRTQAVGRNSSRSKGWNQAMLGIDYLMTDDFCYYVKNSDSLVFEPNKVTR